MKEKLAVIFDPVCGTSKGHNFRTMIKYADWLKDTLDIDSELWIPESDCNQSETKFPLIKSIPWVYEYYLPVNNHTVLAQSQTIIKTLKNKSKSKVVRGPLYICSALNHAVSQRKIEKAFLDAFKRNASYVFLPGADMYSILALASLSSRGLIPKELNIVLRLMGVMESAGYFPKARSAMFAALKVLIKNHTNVKITAETEKYAMFLARHLKIEIPVTHIPTNKNTHNINDYLQPKKSIKVVCLGGARADKGYFELVGLVNYARKIFGRHIEFYIQSMAQSNSEYNPAYELSMAKTLNIVLLPSFLSDKELFDHISQADIVFLPYSQGTYELRGSAILFDSLGAGKPILGRANTGFGLTIDIAGLGFTFKDINEFGAALGRLINLTNEQKKNLHECQTTYLAKMNENLEEVFDGKNIVRFY